jgi:hypothetical protein
MARTIDGTSGPDTLFGDFRNGTLHGHGASQTRNGLGVTTSCMAIALALMERPKAGTTSSTAGMATIFSTATPMRCTKTPWAVTTF